MSLSRRVRHGFGFIVDVGQTVVQAPVHAGVIEFLELLARGLQPLQNAMTSVASMDRALNCQWYGGKNQDQPSASPGVSTWRVTMPLPGTNVSSAT